MVLSLRPMAKKQSRINEQLLEYWTEVKGDSLMPKESDINPEALKNIWNSCFLIGIVPEEEPRYKYSYLGQDIIEAYGAEGDSKEVCEQLIYPAPAPLTAKFADIEAEPAPCKEDNEFVNAKGLTVKYRSVMLPLAHADGKIGYILGGMKWKAF